jgi:hypothetical protein
VVLRDPKSEIEGTPVPCTDPKAFVQQDLVWVVPCWHIEVTVQELRAHLGVETQRQWSERAIGRTTLCLSGLFSMITLMAVGMISDSQLPVSRSAW